MSKKTISDKAVFYACLAEIAEIVSNDIAYHDKEATYHFELAYSDNELVSEYDELEYKRQVAKKNAFAEILEALNKL